MKHSRLAVAAILAAGISTVAWAAGTWSNLPIVGGAAFCTQNINSGIPGTATICGGQTPAGPPFLTGNELIPADTGSTAGGGAPPQTVTIPVTALGNYGGTPRNYLDNAALNITATNGTSTVTGQINAASAVATNMAADRWLLSTNVAVGAGRTAIVTSSPSPPTGFTNVMKVTRLSGALTQPVCVHQEIPSASATELAGKTVTFSAYLDALAGLSADNGNVVSMVVYSGTGADQGFGSWTASPAITPAWTGIATAVNQSVTITTTFTRYAVAATIPSTATEVGVAICFTPTATGAGATDGFAWTGAQLEVGPAASSFEVIRKQDDLVRAQQFFYKITEGAVGSVRAVGLASTTSLAEGLLQFPTTMFAAPTMTYTAGFAACTTTACSGNTACTAIRTSTLQAFAADVNRVMIECTSAAGFPAAGSSIVILDNGGSGVITAWAGM